MSNIVYRDDSGKLRLGSDTNADQLSKHVNRCDSTKEIVRRNGMFVEVNLDGTGTRNLCSTN